MLQLIVIPKKEHVLQKWTLASCSRYSFIILKWCFFHGVDSGWMVFLGSGCLQVKTIESFALDICNHFLTAFKHVTRAKVNIEEAPWKRLEKVLLTWKIITNSDISLPGHSIMPISIKYTYCFAECCWACPCVHLLSRVLALLWGWKVPKWWEHPCLIFS